ncbi:thioesterase [Coccidioides immitis RS]|uniref:Thioesterase n=7 Tax=Coccidioides TaxID=5500 RepID=J3K4J3_COCIM|nr:thioesterase [Coccidioides immitis RS]XP_003065137.1 thioesterase family protein [Coccidioides posadasii C735 delta SOWgp]EFW15914.1 thioesterase [Coccidioides posadasii str. Silveira]KMM69225.1 hypothetical protein CPAG_05546 [Coccidioides posadasii RMSCC 3488]KMP06357.1 hypothetical protein CIRG_06038 [Coccidioides immitis RMSCC 2394]KMU80440.1 hypothetical protein CISG_02291 [Coccidioides immitis RMSCC 3703]KMU83923.1 hypothetical protein CIHG_01707 [Coccidioides immitis H538.4]TPX2267|eukprot:XP_003065137.1 thioesterase family protein [Coccidioides posadasii C735 delta SOWgp]
MELTEELFVNRIKSMYERSLDEHENSFFDAQLQDKVRFHSASLAAPVRATFRSVVTLSMCNRLESLHGGCAATLIDVLTSVILLGLGKPGMFSYGGVTRSLDVKYLRPVPEGVEMEIICELVNMGKRLAMLRGEIRRVDNGDLCVVGMHDKANTDPVVQRL